MSIFHDMGPLIQHFSNHICKKKLEWILLYWVEGTPSLRIAEHRPLIDSSLVTVCVAQFNYDWIDNTINQIAHADWMPGYYTCL